MERASQFTIESAPLPKGPVVRGIQTQGCRGGVGNPDGGEEESIALSRRANPPAGLERREGPTRRRHRKADGHQKRSLISNGCGVHGATTASRLHFCRTEQERGGHSDFGIHLGHY
jgi:hypothetical protein